MLELLKSRRSIRKYENKSIEKNQIEELMKCALLSPTSKNSRPWEFIVVQDKDTLEKLSHSKGHGGAFLKDAPLGIVVLADPSKSEVWIEDASIASTIIHISAHSMGLGSCWIQIRGRNHSDSLTASEYVKETLNIPSNLEVDAIIAIGYPAEEKRSRNDDELLSEKIHYEVY